LALCPHKYIKAGRYTALAHLQDVWKDGCKRINAMHLELEKHVQEIAAAVVALLSK
jgi:hypothetical protein